MSNLFQNDILWDGANIKNEHALLPDGIAMHQTEMCHEMNIL